MGEGHSKPWRHISYLPTISAWTKQIPDGELDKKAEYYIRNPEPSDLPGCVVMVFRAGRFLNEDTKVRVRNIIRTAEDIRIKVAIVLTEVDLLHTRKGPPLSGKEVARVFHDEAVQEAVEQASVETGIPGSFIHPVVSYTHETETITEMNILLLYTLRKILDLAELGASSRHR